MIGPSKNGRGPRPGVLRQRGEAIDYFRAAGRSLIQVKPTRAPRRGQGGSIFCGNVSESRSRSHDRDAQYAKLRDDRLSETGRSAVSAAAPQPPVPRCGAGKRQTGLAGSQGGTLQAVRAAAIPSRRKAIRRRRRQAGLIFISEISLRLALWRPRWVAWPAAPGGISCRGVPIANARTGRRHVQEAAPGCPVLPRSAAAR